MDSFDSFEKIASVELKGEYDSLLQNKKIEENDIVTSGITHPIAINATDTILNIKKMEQQHKFNSKFKHVLINPGEPVPVKHGYGIQDKFLEYVNYKGPTPPRQMYTIVEILLKYPYLLNNNAKHPYTFVDYASGTGSWTLAIALLRQMFAEKASKKDFYYTLEYHLKTMKPKNKDAIKKYFRNNNYERWKRLLSSEYNNGDLTDINTIQDLMQLFKMSRHTNLQLVVADGYVKPKQIMTSEQEQFRLLYGEILAIIAILQKNAHCVIRMSSMNTKPTKKLLLILKGCFEKVIIDKPIVSRVTEDVRYVICKGFKYDKEKRNEIFNVLIKSFRYLFKNNNKLCIDLFPKMILTSEDEKTISDYDMKLSNNRMMGLCVEDYILSNKLNDQNTRKVLLESQKLTTEAWVKMYLKNIA